MILEPNRSESNYWSDVWHYRELFYILSWKEISIRYKQTIIGILWAIIRPVLAMVIFTFIFSKVAGLPSDGNTPYPILVYTAMLPWQFFSSAISSASASIVANSSLITKIYFPRVIIPFSSIITSVIDFMISLSILILLMFYYQYFPDWKIIFLPIFFIIAFFSTIGISLFITALNVKYRDFKFIVPFIIQFGLYVSPVGYSSSVIPDNLRFLYSLNPMVGVIDGFRWAVLGAESIIYLEGIVCSILFMIFFLVIGMRQFRSMEKTFADII